MLLNGGEVTQVLGVQPTVKSKARAVLPQPMVSFIQGCRYRGTMEHIDFLLSERKYRALYTRANANVSESSVMMPNGCRVQVPADVKQGFARDGWTYLDEVDEFVRSMELAANKKTLWDIGAFQGLFSLAFVLGGEGRRSFAFEPNPVSRAKFRECLSLNPAACVEVFDSPVGLSGELVEFCLGPFFTAAAGLSLRPDEKDLAQIVTVSVDQMIETNLQPPDFIKIDVEGLEFDVLRGAEKLLREKRPLLSMELHPSLLRQRETSALAIAQYLQNIGYGCYTNKVKPAKKSYFQRQDNFRLFAM